MNATHLRCMSLFVEEILNFSFRSVKFGWDLSGSSRCSVLLNVNFSVWKWKQICNRWYQMCFFFLSHLLLYNYNIRKNWLYVTDNLAHSIANYIRDWTIFFILLLQQLLTLLSVTCISTWFGNLSVKLRSQIQNLIKRWLGCSLHLPSRSKVSHRRLTTPTVCHL